MKMHDEEGVDVRLGTKLDGARGNGAVEKLTLSRGEPLECDAVVVGIGVAPEAGWLKGSGLEIDGVLTDHAGRTSCQMSGRQATSRGASTIATASIAEPSTGTQRPDREWP